MNEAVTPSAVGQERCKHVAARRLMANRARFDRGRFPRVYARALLATVLLRAWQDAVRSTAATKRTMELRRELLTAEMLDPGTGESVITRVEVRFDPLTGHTSRILPERGLMPPNDFDLEAFANETQPSCPFCAERINQLTPRLPTAVHPEGRIARGHAVLFPNLHAYSSHSSVSVYSPELHYLPLERITPRLMADNVATQVAYAKAVIAADPESRWASINANHMLPSGSSLFHPHLQGIVDSQPTTFQRLLAEVPAQRFNAYLEAERRDGQRHLGNTGQVEWLVSFAPIAPAELRVFIPSFSSTVELSEDLIEELGYGLSLALGAYAEMGYESFNLASYGVPPGAGGYPLNLRIACRSNLKQFYRSDSTLLERLHWEGAIDLPPETIAERIGDRFRS
jgi:UDPglucose--hexose-1-phosphate uridylyltransferase